MAGPPPPSPLLRRAAREHRRLERQVAATSPNEHATVLHLGSAVLLHGLFEEAYLLPAHRYLDPGVRALLMREHREIDEALALLEELLADPSSGEDLTALAAALVGRLRAHVERDRRILYRPLGRWAPATGMTTVIAAPSTRP